MHVAATLPDLEFEVLLGLRKPVIKLESLVRHGRAFQDLYVHNVVPQIEHVDAVHIALPYELRPILCAEDPRKQYK